MKGQEAKLPGTEYLPIQLYIKGRVNKCRYFWLRDTIDIISVMLCVWKILRQEQQL